MGIKKRRDLLMIRKSAFRKSFVVTVLIAVAGLLAACGSSSQTQVTKVAKAKPSVSSSKVAVPDTAPGDLAGIPHGKDFAKPRVKGKDYIYSVGNGQSITWPKGQKLKIAVFAIGSDNSWLVAWNKWAVKEAKIDGGTATIFNANFSTTTQDQQFATAITSGNYNAIIVNPVDPPLACKLFSQVAPAKNLPVVVVTSPICNRNGDNGDAAWQPGTLAFVGGHDLESGYQAFTDKVASLHPDATIGFFTGPPANGPAENSIAALKATEAKYPNFKVAAIYRTNWTSADGLKDGEEFLQAHPSVKIIISTYSGITDGILAAARDRGVSGLQIYTIGGSGHDVKNIEDGKVAMAMPLYPASQSVAAVQDLYLMSKGRPVPRFLGNDGHPLPASLLKKEGPDAQIFLTKKNIASFVPQYP